MTQMLDRPRVGTYERPSLEPLGSLQALTEGAGPDGELTVVASGFSQPYAPPALEVLGTHRALTKGAGPNGEPIVMATGGGIPGGGPPFAEHQDAPVVVA